MKRFLFTLTILFFCATSIAQDKDTTHQSNFQHEVGFHAGSTSGYGPSYRMWYKNFGIQISFLPTYKHYNSGIYSATRTNIVYGISLNYKLKHNKYVDLYSFINYSSNYSKNVNLNDFPPYNTVSTSINSNIGAGLGFDFKITPALILSTQMGYGIYGIEKFYQGNIAGGISILYKL